VFVELEIEKLYCTKSRLHLFKGSFLVFRSSYSFLVLHTVHLLTPRSWFLAYLTWTIRFSVLESLLGVYSRFICRHSVVLAVGYVQHYQAVYMSAFDMVA